MIPVLPTSYKISDINLQKMVSINKIGQVLSIFEEKSMVRTASTNSSDPEQNGLISLFMKMLSCLNLKVNEDNVADIVNRLSSGVTESSLNKQATHNKNSQERSDEIKIASKSIKDSHYQIDISKDIVEKYGKKVIMVSCYARDAYLGRYLIKRNYFYTKDRNKFADSAYDEILTKISTIKDRYYNDLISVSGIFEQIKQSLDGVISEIEIKEDVVGTNISR